MIRRGFTLIELLTVMAISVILFSLIAYPLVQSFNLTRAGQAFSNAQDLARLITSKIGREIGNSASVRSGAGTVPVALVNDNGIQNTSVNTNSIVIRLPDKSQQSTVDVVLPFAKLDLVNPAEGDQTQLPSGPFTNPVNGYQDPTLSSPKGQPVLPVAPGTTLVRYWIGRRIPFAEYENPYSGILMAVSSARDNFYVLYRAEVEPFIYRAGQGSNGDTSVSWRPNLAFFQSDAVTDTLITDIDNPKFFEPNRTAGGVIINDDKEPAPVKFSAVALTQGDRIANWQAVAVNQLDVSRIDMVQPVYDLKSRLAQYDQNGVPRIIPLVQFRPERVNSDPATPQIAVRQGQESDTAASAAADEFLTQYGLWGGQVVRAYPQGWNPNSNTADQYLVGLAGDNAGTPGAAPGFSVYGYDPAVSPFDYVVENMTELFDQYTYAQLLSHKGAVQSNDQIYPFTAAVTAANNRVQTNTGSGWLNNAMWRSIFTPLTYDSQRGKVIVSFGIDEVGNSNLAPSDPTKDNLPGMQTGAPLSPQQQGALTGSFNGQTTINQIYNIIGQDFQSLLPNGVHRFIDLRNTPNSDGTLSPLDPTYTSGSNTITGFNYNTPDGGYRSKVQIVPGSEIVTGPDQLAGPHQGQPIRYIRVTSGDPGPNQYKLNYADLQEPLNPSTGKIDYSQAYPGTDIQPYLAGFNPRVYDPTNVISAVLQPRYKVGYLQFDSDPNQPLGVGTASGGWINVYYRFQFTGNRTGTAAQAGGSLTDAFAVDYDTRQLMSVLLTVLDYAQSTLPNPQSVTLKSTSLVRNYTR
jgi:prepilin-type N-terminal cleavage/methylation domain-containing protein